MSHEERDKIAPSLATFASLFSHLLVTIHDTEFYQRQSSGGSGQASSSHRWMPFTLGQLVPMALALRDVALGLVELAFPESRPAVRGRDNGVFYSRTVADIQKQHRHIPGTGRQWEGANQMV